MRRMEKKSSRQHESVSCAALFPPNRDAIVINIFRFMQKYSARRFYDTAIKHSWRDRTPHTSF